MQQDRRDGASSPALSDCVQRREERRDRRAERCVECVRRHTNDPTPGERNVVLVEHDATFPCSTDESSKVVERRSLL